MRARRGANEAIQKALNDTSRGARQTDIFSALDRVGPDGSYVAVGFSGHGFKLSPAVGQMMADLITEGPGAHPDLPTFRLSRFAEGKLIRGTYGDWLMC